MEPVTDHGAEYVAWQNRSVAFYSAARQLYFSENYAPASYCAVMAIELILKATIRYWDRSFDPEQASHGIAKMVRVIGNKVNGGKGVKVPQYFYAEKRFLSVSRYPNASKGIYLPATFLSDLDEIFLVLLPLVPFQHNTALKKIANEKCGEMFESLFRDNSIIEQLLKTLGAPGR